MGSEMRVKFHFETLFQPSPYFFQQFGRCYLFILVGYTTHAEWHTLQAPLCF